MFNAYAKIRNNRLQKNGFTIVELLVVIVVIGILAAITIVSYSGITSRANSASLQADLSSATKLLNMYRVEHDTYPTGLTDNCPNAPISDTRYCLKTTSGNEFKNYSGDAQTFDLEASKVGDAVTVYHVSNDKSPYLLTKVVATGGVVADVGGYVTHTFTSTGSFTVTTGGTISALVVGGGGGGGKGFNSGTASAGGGAGGVIDYASLTVSPGDTITVNVGAAGVGSTLVTGYPGSGEIAGTNGGASSLVRNSSTLLIADGGGGGGGYTIAGKNGGSGGGGNAIAGQTTGNGVGNAGGVSHVASVYPGGGGGGYSSAGSPGSGNYVGGNGGNGYTLSLYDRTNIAAFSGKTIIASGGGGGCYGNGTPGTGQNGNSGSCSNAAAGSANSYGSGGGGGGVNAGAYGSEGPAGQGAAGIVVIKYAK